MVKEFYNRSLGLNISKIRDIQISVIGYMTRTFERLLYYIGVLHDCFKCEEDLDDVLPVVKAYNNDLIKILDVKGANIDIHPDRIIMYLFCKNVECYFDKYVGYYNKFNNRHGEYDKIELATDKLFEAGKYASIILTASYRERLYSDRMKFFVESFIDKLFDNVVKNYINGDILIPEEKFTEEGIKEQLTNLIVKNELKYTWYTQ